MSYNVHSLIHLVDDVQYFGVSLNKISAFPFESYLHQMKRGVRQGMNPISSLFRRMKALEAVNPDRRNKEYDIKIGTPPNCYFLHNEYVAVYQRKQGERYFCHMYRQDEMEPLFNDPCDSRLLDIYYMKMDTPYVEQLLNLNDLSQKMVGINHEEGTALFKYLHL